MPEAYRYAHAVTLSLDHSLTDEECVEFIRLCQKADWYAVVFENDANGRKHAHAGLIYKTARKPGNVKAGTFLCSKLLVDAGAAGAHALKVKAMITDQWIANYMQKDGDLTIHNLPDSFEQVRHYFPDTAVVKSMNPEMERWERMYNEDKCPHPVTTELAMEFFLTHMNVKRDLKVLVDRKKLTERCTAFAMFVNGSVEFPEPKARKKADGKSTRGKECGCMFCTSGCPDECLRKPK